MRRVIRVGAVVAAVAIWAGCSDKRIDTGNVESIIAERYSGDVVEVRCPEVVRTREGETFECRVVLAGGEEQVVFVEQLGGTRFRWRPGPAPAGRDGSVAGAKE